MSDERLRELERRWKETGSVEDEAAWLSERVRAGELTEERLRLAAALGQPAAVAASGSDRALDILAALISAGQRAYEEPGTFREWGLGEPVEWSFEACF